jgi:hypothetical protein
MAPGAAGIEVYLRNPARAPLAAQVVPTQNSPSQNIDAKDSSVTMSASPVGDSLCDNEVYVRADPLTALLSPLPSLIPLPERLERLCIVYSLHLCWEHQSRQTWRNSISATGDKLYSLVCTRKMLQHGPGCAGKDGVLLVSVKSSDNQ